jgi:hypothetical protein
VESNARANAALEAGSFEYATIQTSNAQQYANQSASFLESAIPQIEQFVSQPTITEFLNYSTFQEAQAFISQNPDMTLSNNATVLLQDFGLPTDFNFSQILKESFMPINATAFGELPNIASALSSSDQYESAYLQYAQANNTQLQKETPQPSEFAGIPTISSQPSQVTSTKIPVRPSTTEIILVVAIAVVISSTALIIVNHKRKQHAKQIN